MMRGKPGCQTREGRESKVKMVVKFPNWYEHFQGSGFDLKHEPNIFDGIYTGTETRDPVITDQHLQQYESYEIINYFENIAPQRNGGGWVDTYSIRYLDRYAEQLWDTIFAKAHEITLFEWSALTRPFETGDRSAWENLPTSFNFSEMTNGVPARPGRASPVIRWNSGQGCRPAWQSHWHRQLSPAVSQRRGFFA